jgi:hypothetical protein
MQVFEGANEIKRPRIAGTLFQCAERFELRGGIAARLVEAEDYTV